MVLDTIRISVMLTAMTGVLLFIYVFMSGKGFSESGSDNYFSSGLTENPFPVLFVFTVISGPDGYFVCIGLIIFKNIVKTVSP